VSDPEKLAEPRETSENNDAAAPFAATQVDLPAIRGMANCSTKTVSMDAAYQR
jgi:hypothetical protein